MADAATAAGVAVAGAVILAVRGCYWLDPAVALAIAVLVACHAVRLIRTILARIRPAPADQAAQRVARATGPGSDRGSKPGCAAGVH